jgi:hypothetical protein
MFYSYAPAPNADDYKQAQEYARRFGDLIPPESVGIAEAKGKPHDRIVSFEMGEGRCMSVAGARRDLFCYELRLIAMHTSSHKFIVTDLY